MTGEYQLTGQVSNRLVGQIGMELWPREIRKYTLPGQIGFGNYLLQQSVEKELESAVSLGAMLGREGNDNDFAFLHLELEHWHMKIPTSETAGPRTEKRHGALDQQWNMSIDCDQNLHFGTPGRD